MSVIALCEAVTNVENSVEDARRANDLDDRCNRAMRSMLNGMKYCVLLHANGFLIVHGLHSFSISVLVLVLYLGSLAFPVTTAWSTLNRLNGLFSVFEQWKEKLNGDLDFIIRHCEDCEKMHDSNQGDYEKLLMRLDIMLKKLNGSKTPTYYRLYLISVVVLAIGYGFFASCLFYGNFLSVCLDIVMT